MALSKNQDSAEASSTETKNQPAAPNPELEAAKARIAELEAANADMKSSFAKANASLLDLSKKHEALLDKHDDLLDKLEDAQKAPASAEPSEPSKPRDPTEDEIKSFEMKKENAFENGRVYCQAFKTVLAGGEARYAGMYFFMEKASAERLQGLGDLRIVAEK